MSHLIGLTQLEDISYWKLPASFAEMLALKYQQTFHLLDQNFFFA